MKIRFHISFNFLFKSSPIYLYGKDILTLEQASKLAEISYLDFQKELGNRNISIHYDEEELEKDLETLNFLDQA
ncbi:MAG: UPF0175 family protein [Leptospiraceae bacterium]|nr:UPF0175 family protein [Leptospiraceae bacterium]